MGWEYGILYHRKEILANKSWVNVSNVFLPQRKRYTANDGAAKVQYKRGEKNKNYDVRSTGALS